MRPLIHQQQRFVVNGATAHVDGFESGSARALKGGVVAVAHQDVIFRIRRNGLSDRW